MSNNRKVKILDVSPEVATRWLNQCNNHNRPIRNPKVAEFAEAMKRGEWRLTAEPVAFAHPYIDTAGKQQGETLLNGQHRLWAIVDSGATVPLTVWWGCEPDEFEVIDRNSVRTFGDILSTTRADLADPTGVATTCTAFVRFALGVRSDRAGGVRLANINEIMRAIEPEILAATAYRRRLKKFAPRCIASILVLSQIINPDTTETIVSQLKDAVGFSDRDPIRALHLRLTEHFSSTTRDMEHMLHYRACHAFATRLRGEHIKTLRITSEGLAYLRQGAKAKIEPLVTAFYGSKIPNSFWNPSITTVD